MLIKTAIWLIIVGFVLSRQIPIKSNFITSDIFDNVYVISKSDLKQLNSTGDVLKTYSNRNLGDITFVDATNPMRILLFYANFNQVVFINTKLSPISEPVSLDDLGFTSVGIACSSSQNGFWIFDTRNSQPVLISSALQVIYKGTKIQFTDSLWPAPIYMSEQGKKLFIAFQGKGIYVFDQTAKFEKFLPIQDLKYIQVMGSYVYYLAEQKLRVLNLENMENLPYFDENQQYDSFCLINEQLVIADKQQLFFYKKDNLQH
ncbi:MAG TPA: hypothetical protein PKG63_03380 [Bacteroidales bacterium]|jgi:hypothetical protein|nr:hypothetical protein [Bacteroidales bacterium]HOU98862.1 hypothetical protein [Bacteroidales bacterium]